MEKQFCFVLLIVIGGVLGWNAEQEAVVDSFINDVYMSINRIPGLILAIVENDKVVVSKGYGYKNVDKELKADGDTLTCIGSITKSFVGTLVVKILHEKFPKLGEKALDTPLKDLLPSTSNITFSDRYRAETMTFRDLLSHRSCLVSPDVDLLFDTVPSIVEKRYRIRYQQENCTFRNGFQYNNAIFGLIGELIGDIAGVQFEQLLVQFMQEIGMNEASYLDQDGNFENLGHMSQAYYVRENKTQQYSPRLLTRIHSMVGAGGVLASAKHMAQYIRFHLNLGKVGNNQVVPEEVMKRIYKISNGADISLPGKNSTESDPVTGGCGYSLGFNQLLIDGWAVTQHNGYWPIFNSELLIIPALKNGIYISSNGPGMVGFGDSGSGLTHIHLALIIFDILRGKSSNVTDMRAIPNLSKINKVDDFGLHTLPRIDTSHLGQRSKVIRNNAKDIVGLYGHPTNGDLIISYDSSNNSLQMKLGQFGTGNLIEKSPLRYKIDWTGDILHDFYSSGINAPVIDHFIDFGYEKKALIFTDDFSVLLEFTKGASIDTFPPIPWSPDSCAP